MVQIICAKNWNKDVEFVYYQGLARIANQAWWCHFCARNWNEDIEFDNNQGLLVDNGNDPALENNPQDEISSACIFVGHSRGYIGIGMRATSVPVD